MVHVRIVRDSDSPAQAGGCSHAAARRPALAYADDSISQYIAAAVVCSPLSLSHHSHTRAGPPARASRQPACDTRARPTHTVAAARPNETRGKSSPIMPRPSHTRVKANICLT